MLEWFSKHVRLYQAQLMNDLQFGARVPWTRRAHGTLE